MNVSRNVSASRTGFPRSVVALLLASTLGSASAGTPRDNLLAMVPPDAGFTIVIEGLRDRSREIFASPLAKKIRALPAVTAWEKSEKAQGWLKARNEIEAGLGVSPSILRDEILGDAVVLAVLVPPGRSSDEASGLLLTRVRDRKMLDRLIAKVNASEIASGTLKQVVDMPGRDGSPTISHRKFAPGTKPDEWYTVLEENTFVWSNSEPMLRSAVARRATGEGLGSTPRFRAVDDALPKGAVACVYLDPRFLERVAKADARGQKKEDETTVLHALAALEYTGAAVLWQDGPVVHFHETLDPKRLPERFLGKGLNHGPNGPVLERTPSTAVVVGSWRWDLSWVLDTLLSQLPPTERPRVDAVILMAKGMLLGKDLQREILPFVGSSASAYLDAPIDAPLAAGCSIELMGRPEVAQAIDNGLQTFAALLALDPNRKGGPVRVQSAERDGLRVTTLAGGSRSWSFATKPDRLVIGSDPDIVRRMVAPPDRLPRSAADVRIGQIKRAFFAKSDEFLVVDLEVLHRLANNNREEWARDHAKNRGGTVQDTRRDLDQALELIEPFGAIFLSWTVTPVYDSAHQVVGLIGRGAAAKR